MSQGAFNLGQSLNEALALQRQGRLRDAEKIYARVLKAAPDNFDALNLLGTVKAQLGRMGEAHRLLGAAVKINPRVPQALDEFRRGSARAQAHREALECFNKALALAPDDAGVLNQSRQCADEHRPAAGGACRIPASAGARAAACRRRGSIAALRRLRSDSRKRPLEEFDRPCARPRPSGRAI